jgi:hypothetical protein
MAGNLSYTPVKTEKLLTSQSLELPYLQPLQSHALAMFPLSRFSHTDRRSFLPSFTRLYLSPANSPLVSPSLTLCHYPLATLIQSSTTLSLTLCYPKLANLHHPSVFHCGTSQFVIITVTKSLTTLLSFSHSSLLHLTHRYVLQSLITLTRPYPYPNIGNVLNLVSE